MMMNCCEIAAIDRMSQVSAEATKALEGLMHFNDTTC